LRVERVTSAKFGLHAGNIKFSIQNKELISKGKAIPLQVWTGPEGSRRLRLPDFKTIDT